MVVEVITTMRCSIVVFLFLLSVYLSAKENPHAVIGHFILRDWLEFMPDNAFNHDGPGPTLTASTVKINHVRTATLTHRSGKGMDKGDTAVHSVFLFDKEGRLSEVQTLSEVWTYTYDPVLIYCPSTILVSSMQNRDSLELKYSLRYDEYGNPVEQIIEDFRDSSAHVQPTHVAKTTFRYWETKRYNFVEIKLNGKSWAVYRHSCINQMMEEQNYTLYRDKYFREHGRYTDSVSVCYKRADSPDSYFADIGFFGRFDTICAKSGFHFEYKGNSDMTISYVRYESGQLRNLIQGSQWWHFSYLPNGLPDEATWGDDEAVNEYGFRDHFGQDMQFEYEYYE